MKMNNEPIGTAFGEDKCHASRIGKRFAVIDSCRFVKPSDQNCGLGQYHHLR